MGKLKFSLWDEKESDKAMHKLQAKGKKGEFYQKKYEKIAY